MDDVLAVIAAAVVIKEEEKEEEREEVKALNGPDDGWIDDRVVVIVGSIRLLLVLLVVVEFEDGEDLAVRTGSVFVPQILRTQSCSVARPKCDRIVGNAQPSFSCVGGHAQTKGSWREGNLVLE